MDWKQKASYAVKVLPGYLRQQLTRRVPSGPVHLIFALADHFEPYITPQGGPESVSQSEQVKRVEEWCGEYPKRFAGWRDHDGQPFKHSYFCAAERYDSKLTAMLAEHCHAGWGEVEIHLHHGISSPDTAENTRRSLLQFRDALAFRHHCLAREEGDDTPKYSFVHGNFALANSANGRWCGVDSEMQILADTGCYADFTLPSGFWHPAQISKINSLYECSLPLDRSAPHRRGKDLQAFHAPEKFPLVVQGPLTIDFAAGKPRFDNGSITRSNPPSIRRLDLWKSAAVRVLDRPDWLFIKLHAHGMDPKHKDSLLGQPMNHFLQKLLEDAHQRKEIVHFTTAREMVNMILAACDGREGNPGLYRDYRFKQICSTRTRAGLYAQPAHGLRP